MFIILLARVGPKALTQLFDSSPSEERVIFLRGAEILRLSVSFYCFWLSEWLWKRKTVDFRVGFSQFAKLDNRRGDRHGPNQDSHSYRHRAPPRFYDGSMTHHENRRSPGDFRVGGNGAYNSFYDSPPGHSPGSGSGFWPMGGGGGGFRPIGAEARGYGSNHQPPPMVGHKRGYPFVGRGGSPDNFDNSNFAKLFVGSVPRTATEEDVRPLFEKHGNVIEVALIKDKRTGQQQGCCFIKYATSEEADRAIRALHNQHTLPGSMGPIQVRYADGERERLGAVEFKLFVGSLNKQATEKEVEEIFSPYGRVEDVYLMRDEFKQSRGCGFVKYGNRDVALMAIKGLHGIYMMRGCDQPLTVRFADPKRPRSGESRSGFGGPGPHLPAPLIDDDHRGFSQLPPRSSEMTLPLNSGDSGVHLQGSMNSSSSTTKQSPAQAPAVGQQVTSLQKPFQSSPQFPPSAQLQRQNSASYSQQASLSSVRPLGVQQYPLSAAQISYAQPSTSHQPTGGVVSGQSGPQTPVPQQSSLITGLQPQLSNNLQPHAAPTPINQQQHPASVHQSPSQLAQMLSQQTQSLQASFQSSQQAFSQLQQQLQQMQPSNQGLSPQQNSQASKVQWSGNVAQGAGGVTPAANVSSPALGAFPVSSTAQAVAPAKCNWTEHTSPDGYKYYYNGLTGESRWEKPEELTFVEQQQQKQSHQPQTQSFPLSSSPLSLPQNQQMQFQGPQQSHIPSYQQLHIQHAAISSSYQVSGVASHQNIQEPQASQDWMWKNNPAGA